MYCIYKNIAVDAVWCCMPVGNDTMCAWHVCGGAPILNQCPYWCPTYMTLFWYSDRDKFSTYWYVLVCTLIHFLYRSVQWLVLGTYQYVPVQIQYILNTLFLYHRSRFQMWHSITVTSGLSKVGSAYARRIRRIRRKIRWIRKKIRNTYLEYAESWHVRIRSYVFTFDNGKR